MYASHSSFRRLLRTVAAAAVCLGLVTPALAHSLAWPSSPTMLDEPTSPETDPPPEPEGHLVISEVMTGGSSAVDEFIELYNPTLGDLPLGGLELIYVTATGTTVSRRAIWESGAPPLPAGGHMLVAHENGVFASIADHRYASGIAAAGGSVAIRIVGAATAIDAVGWGTAASTWLEGDPAPAPPAGSSIERLPGGQLGSGQDTDHNAIDFVIRQDPDPQNSLSPPITPAEPQATPTVSASPTPAATASPGPSATPSASPEASASPTPTPIPSPGLVSIADARALPNGTIVTVQGVTLTASDFADGGGYLADGEAGIAVLVTGGAFERGMKLIVTGQLDDRFWQRTIRATGAGLQVVEAGAEPSPIAMATGGIDELVEGRLVLVRGRIVGAPTSLAAGVAYDLNDGSGNARVIVGAGSGIDVGSWSRGSTLELAGVVGQRDSSGTGSAGYRVQPRDPADVRSLEGPAAPPSPTPRPSVPPGPASPPPAKPPLTTPGPPARPPLVTIAAARAAEANARLRIRGVVTAGTGLLNGSAVIQDATAAILLRVADGAGPLARGRLIEVEGTRATFSGMLTLRISQPPVQLGVQPEPTSIRLATGALSEQREAQLVVLRGALTAAPRRSSAGNLFLSIDDGSGPASVVALSTSAIGSDGLQRGSWIEVEGILGQETTGSQPDRGYRVWPRAASDVRLVAAATSPASSGSAGGSADTTVDDSVSGLPPSAVAAPTLAQDLSVVAGPGAFETHASLVVGDWPELGVSGLLWDGRQLAALEQSAGTAAMVTTALAGARPPAVVGIRGNLVATDVTGLAIPLIAADSPDGLRLVGGRPAPPDADVAADDALRWVRIVGTLDGLDDAAVMQTAEAAIQIQVACSEGAVAVIPDGAAVIVEGIGVGGRQPRLIVPCGGLHRIPSLAAAGLGPAVAAQPPVATLGDVEPTGAGVVGSAAGAWTLLAASLLAAAGVGTVAIRAGTAGRLRGELERRLAGESAVEGGVADPRNPPDGGR